MKQKNGFTLIELLAVIVILAVIALIATPLIMNVIDDAKQGSAKDSVYAIIKAGKLKVARDSLRAPITFTEADTLEYKGTKPEKMKLTFESKGKSKIQIYIDGTCFSKSYDDKEVVENKRITSASICVEDPIVVDVTDGMIPVRYDSAGNMVKADISSAWYDYDNKEWANAVSVKSASRSKYTTASAGTQIEENDILGYFVYIPRYRYQLWNAEGGQSNEQEIKIEFERKHRAKSNGTNNGSWLTHPAFTFGTTELNGIWVGKFELTGTGTNPTTKPNSVSLTNQNISTAFNTIKLFQTNTEYALASYDAHMIKNMEWGATVYLSHSKYGTCSNGVCTEVWINNTNTGYGNGTAVSGQPQWGPSITGCSGLSVSAGAKNNLTACEIERDYKKNGVKASTTGNIYGIYDMSGGTFERVMASTINADGSFMTSGSGFTSTLDPKYWDQYEYNTSNMNYSIMKLGDATKEVRKKTVVQVKDGIVMAVIFQTHHFHGAFVAITLIMDQMPASSMCSTQLGVQTHIVDLVLCLYDTNNVATYMSEEKYKKITKFRYGITKFENMFHYLHTK